jgi:hypothetical protein
MKLVRKIKMIGYVNTKEVIEYFDSYYGIKLTARQIRDLALNYMPIDCSFWHDMVSDDIIGGGEEQGGGEVSIDTTTGEDLASALCQKMMGCDWPTYADHQKMSKKKQKEFWNTFRDKLVEGGYNIAGDWLEDHLQHVETLK